MTTAMEGKLTWSGLFDLRMCLIESKEINAKLDKEIAQLKTSKDDLSQRLEKLRLSSKQETIEQLLEDREVVALSQVREEYQSKQKMLLRDLNSVTALVKKFKSDIDRSNQSIQKLEEQCEEAKTSTIVVSGERSEAQKKIEFTRSQVEEQHFIITQLSDDLLKLREKADRYKKRNSELKEIQNGLLKCQKSQELQIAKLHKNIEDLRQKYQEGNKVLKKKIRTLSTHSIQVNQLNVRLTRLKRTTHSLLSKGLVLKGKLSDEKYLK